MGTIAGNRIAYRSLSVPMEMEHAVVGAAKVWSQADTAGASDDDFNLTSVTDTATGRIDFIIANDFSSGDYFRNFASSSTSAFSTSNWQARMGETVFSAGSSEGINEADDGANNDPHLGWFFWALGDLA